MNESLFEKVKCNLCGSDDYHVVYEPRYDLEKDSDLKEKFRSSGDETLIDQVVKCNVCGLIYVNPRLKTDLILEGYSEGSDELFVSQAKGRELTFARSLKIIERMTKGAKGDILDVGTAGGSFLKVAKDSGWTVHGCEPNKWMCSWAKEHYGIDISPGILEDQNYPDASFDVVTLWDVLEHTSDPKATLKECNRILKPGGLLVVNYPDIGSWISRLMARKWVFLLSVHLYYFTPKTVKRILHETGYDVLKIKPHYQRLALGYLMLRMKAYSKLIHKVGSKVFGALRLNDVQVPYWLGQTLVIVRKR